MFAFRIIILTFYFFNWRIYSLPITMPLGRPVQGPYLPGGVWELRGQVRPSVKAGAVSLRPAEKLQTRMLTASGLGSACVPHAHFAVCRTLHEGIYLSSDRELLRVDTQQVPNE